MDESSSILQLENVVDKLIRDYQNLQQERDKLTRDLLTRDEQIAALQEENAQLNAEKQDVHGRVSSLLGKLVEWEKSQEVAQTSQETTPMEEKTVAETTSPAAPAKLFTMEA